MGNELVEVLRTVFREEMGPVNERLEGMEGRLEGMEEQLGGMEDRLDGIETEQREIKQNLSQVADNQQKLSVDMEMVKRVVLETNERVINIESLLENQHTIIELLSARSIEQEAKLKRIK
ncbi:hypothetical protein [Paenibacillus piscarius]|uniref:hypothetical protein n=1 Tax=Paenibacillus piscarius TaxID=1089681 RepID=UPI001EE8C58F|nr:hypothetical protein [Paenibacillus piscarius]